MKCTVIAACLSPVLLLTAFLQAEVVSFQPSPGDLYDLPHNYYFTWGISMQGDVSHRQVTAAQLKFRRIRNWTDGPNELYVHLLDSAPLGVRRYWDNQSGGDNFAGQGIELVTYTNLPDYSQNLVHEFGPAQIATLNNYIQNGANVALGLDPDCHFYNCGISLDMWYQSIPEPGCTPLIALGATLGLLKKHRRR